MSATPPLFNHPDFPVAYRECFDRRVDILWYTPEFSQSQYPPGQQGSEACTLICLLLAQKLETKKLLLWDLDDNYDFVVTVAEAISLGNKTHAWIMGQGLVVYAYLNTEEALRFGGSALQAFKEWNFQVYEENIRERLYANIQSYLTDWYCDPKSDNLYMLLITSGRTILFIFQSKTYKVTLFDSHSHNADALPFRGLVIAQSNFEDLESLCDWYIRRVLKNCYRIEPAQYELAFVYHVAKDGNKGCEMHGTSRCTCPRRH